ncbi:hypothetical protein [Streptomyces sp. NPDC059788]|uniref:hypothetical protein n=1 Tax=Streptomyces sp. NPDC059788 TaxID=3346948 RepID=UPI003651287B
MSGTPAVTVTATRYTVSCLTEDDINARAFDIEIVYRGDGRWAVCRLGKCLSADGTWSYESIPSERRDDWLAKHRFDFETAERLAREAAPHITVNGHTVADALALYTKEQQWPST